MTIEEFLDQLRRDFSRPVLADPKDPPDTPNTYLTYLSLYSGNLIGRLLDDTVFVVHLQPLADRGLCPHIVLWAIDQGIPYTQHTAPRDSAPVRKSRAKRASAFDVLLTRPVVLAPRYQKGDVFQEEIETALEVLPRPKDKLPIETRTERSKERNAAREALLHRVKYYTPPKDATGRDRVPGPKRRPPSLDDLRHQDRPDPRSTENHEADRRMILILEWLLEQSSADVFPEITDLIVEAYRVAGLPPKNRNTEHARVRKVSSLATLNEFPRVALKRETYSAFAQFAIDFLPSPHVCTIPTPPTK